MEKGAHNLIRSCSGALTEKAKQRAYEDRLNTKEGEVDLCRKGKQRWKDEQQVWVIKRRDENVFTGSTSVLVD